MPKKYYTVWKGIVPGVYYNWEDCHKQIVNFKGALYKSFHTEKEAKNALKFSYSDFLKSKTQHILPEEVISKSISVDAASSGNPGVMEYQGVDTISKKKLFKKGPFKKGTNNIGEFLAIVHGLAFLKKNNSALPIYSDSLTAISWVKKKKCNTSLKKDNSTGELFMLIGRAETWLKNNSYNNKIIKWNTKKWGEIPADFGRK